MIRISPLPLQVLSQTPLLNIHPLCYLPTQILIFGEHSWYRGIMYLFLLQLDLQIEKDS